MDVVWIVLLIINILLYGICCFLIMRRKTYTSISIRSPKLLILNIIGNLLMSIIIILTTGLEKINDKLICSFFYYITNFLLFIPLCLRFRRIAKCCEVNSKESLNIQDFGKEKYKYEEKYSIKLMLIIFIIPTAILIIVNLTITRSEAITPIFLYTFDSLEEPKLYDANGIIWLVINFVEHILFITYANYIFHNKIKQKLRFEIISTFIIWFIYSNLVSIFEMIPNFIDDKISKALIYISLVVCYLLLIINGILPIMISFSYKISTVYTFTPKLLNNFYLFLSNETCYFKFKDYLSRINGNPLVLLKLYSDIMSYKPGFNLEVANEDGLSEALNIKNEFFGENNKAHIPEDILGKVKEECNKLNNRNFDKDMFDEALKYSYNELQKFFDQFKKTEEFKNLEKEFFLTTYIHGKMVNVGLINNF